MGNQKIRVLIADDEIDFCFVCKEQINLSSDIICCGVAHDGHEAVRKIYELRPDVVLLDDIMPGLDGLGVLEAMKTAPPPKLPQFIGNSASGQDAVASEFLRCGAAGFLAKPFAPEVLLRRIRLACRHEKAPETPLLHLSGRAHKQTGDTVCLEKIVLYQVMELGVPTKLIGYDYIQEALCILVQNNAVRPTLKEVYAVIAERHDTDGRCVENAIASAVKAALVNKTPAMQQVLDLLPEKNAQKISNGKFLTLVMQNLRLLSL